MTNAELRKEVKRLSGLNSDLQAQLNNSLRNRREQDRRNEDAQALLELVDVKNHSSFVLQTLLDAVDTAIMP